MNHTDNKKPNPVDAPDAVKASTTLQTPVEAATGKELEKTETEDRLPHDAAYKRLFSFKEVIIELLREFFLPQYIDKLDFNTLERVFENHSTTSRKENKVKPQRSSQDIVWKIRYGDSWAFLYIMLEMQSSPDRYMLTRILRYSADMIEELERSGQVEDGVYPAVFPIVYYSGIKPWNYATSTRDMYRYLDNELLEYQPLQSFLLLEERDLHPLTPKEKSPFVRLGCLGKKGQLNNYMVFFEQYLQNVQNEQLKIALSAWYYDLFLEPIGIEKNIVLYTEDSKMEFTTKSELKAAYDAEITEMATVKNYSKVLPALMFNICGKVPSEITAYLNGEPEASVLEKVMEALCMTFNADEVLAVFQKAVSESKAARA